MIFLFIYILIPCALFVTNPDFGLSFSVTNCFGVLSNNSGVVCSGHGNCSSVDSCQCYSNYYGSICNITRCYGKFSNDSDVCSKQGTCKVRDKCNCKSNYYGSNCNITSCGGIFSNDSDACSEQGTCDGPNECKCDSGYEGDICETKIPSKKTGWAKFWEEDFVDHFSKNWLWWTIGGGSGVFGLGGVLCLILISCGIFLVVLCILCGAFLILLVAFCCVAVVAIFCCVCCCTVCGGSGVVVAGKGFGDGNASDDNYEMEYQL